MLFDIKIFLKIEFHKYTYVCMRLRETEFRYTIDNLSTWHVKLHDLCH